MAELPDRLFTELPNLLIARTETMLLTQFDYDLPAELIAQEPAPERDASRLLVLERRSGALQHRTFADLPEYLRAGDVLILNDTRVLPARLYGVFEDGKSVEALLIQPVGDGCWEALVKPAKQARVGRRLSLACGRLPAEVVTLGLHGRRTLRLSADVDLHAILEAYGVMPLPPYIKRRAARSEPRADTGESAPDSDRERYQTVYAEKAGAVAAPTAGLHFTRALLDRIRGLGVQVCPLTLHVGPGTFVPVRAEDITEHRMEAERYAIPDETAAAVTAARREGRRVLAVGTTSMRSLEHAARGRGAVRPGPGAADLFITPGYRFQAVDLFLTNFHLPRSTPLILVAAFAGLALTRRAYAEAIAARYRFYSYGDAMLIL
jgi:S-adenosylmethionine:tRNA ribosyltransferase-isomerase